MSGFHADMDESLQIMTEVEKKWLNRHIYCHHCQIMDEKKLLGRDVEKRVVFQCGCGGIIRIHSVRGI